MLYSACTAQVHSRCAYGILNQLDCQDLIPGRGLIPIILFAHIVCLCIRATVTSVTDYRILERPSENNTQVMLSPLILLEWPVDVRGPKAPRPFNLTVMMSTRIYGVRYCGVQSRAILTYIPKADSNDEGSGDSRCSAMEGSLLLCRLCFRG